MLTYEREEGGREGRVGRLEMRGRGRAGEEGKGKAN